jgi:endothelin-converting enzyme/putative endopeptidase
MDGAARRAHGLDALAPALAAIAGVHDGRSWARALAALHGLGVPAVFSVYADVDDAGPGTLPQLLYVDEVATLLPPEVWRGNDTFALAQQQALVALLAPHMTTADMTRAFGVDADQLAPFVAPPAIARVRGRRNLVARAALPGPFAWDAYWDARAASLPANVSLAAPAYVTLTAAHLAERNDWATLRAYLTARLYVSLAADLPTAPTAADCLASTADAFGDTLGHLWIERNFPANTTRPAVEAMVRATLAAFGRRIDALPWMDDVTRAAAHAKLDAIHVMIGFPDAWDVRDPPFQVVDDHLRNVVAARTAAVAANLGAAGTAADRYAWLMPAFAVNAYYEPTANDIVFPAGILRGAFYAADAPLALNWGSLGVVIGHEITHGFDDQGRAYDASGARRDWWTPYAEAEFITRALCVVDLYSALPGVGNHAVNGVLTLGENLADMGGLAVARDAYDAALAAQYPTRRARRAYEHTVQAVFGVSHEQLFYAGYARMWCAALPADVAYRRLLADPHAPPRWRVDAPTSQSAAYAAAYGCAPPPPDACVVW